MQKVRHSILLSFMLLLAMAAAAQDTLTVQTLTFDSTWTRRGKWLFPPASQKFRKILMYHTLKCFPGVSGDGKYPCGEWDYLTYTFVRDNKGMLDSTYRSRFNYSIAGQTPDSFAYTTAPVWDYYKRYRRFITHSATTSLDTVRVGGLTAFNDDYLFNTASTIRNQYLWRASELQAAGLTAGNITGLRMWVVQPGSARENLKIKIKQLGKDSLTSGQFENNLTTVFDYRKDLSNTGWVDFQFIQAFNWDGSSNLLIEFSYDNGQSANPALLMAAAPSSFSSALSAKGADYSLNFSKAGDFADLGRSFLQKGSSPRTIEAWAFTRAFNDGGIFQAGSTGSNGQDFSLRTSGTSGQWRAQTWGTTDFDVTLNGSASGWHHYAMSYDGSTIKVYYDGKLAGSKAASLNTGDNNLWLGRWAGSYFNGLIDNLRVWDKALNDNTIELWHRRHVETGHPDYANLQADYRMNEGNGNFISDSSPKNRAAGLLNGSTWWSKTVAENLHFNMLTFNIRPVVLFEKGVYTSQLDSVPQLDSIQRAPVQIVRYNNPAGGQKIFDNAANHPNTPTDTLFVWAAGNYKYAYDAVSGARTDSTLIPVQNTLRKTLKEWYSNNVVYEIGRFITPYGINLNLGNGFTWVYDVTDYEPILHDTVDLEAGNNQELIDVKFLFIKGDPPAEVNRIVHISDKGAPSYSYRDLDDDKQMKSKQIDVAPGSAVLRVKTRITGHGHNSNDGSFPHCCEWKDNTHYLFANGQQVSGWKIFRYNECAENPLFPQGGTWPGAREGWCPGEHVKDYEFDVTPHVSAGKITLDYDIDPVPVDNQGMGGGNYVFSMHLIEYKAPKYAVDAELYEIISPSNRQYYARKNPICIDPKIVLRNAGRDPLTSVQFSFGLVGGKQLTYTWNGNLKFMESAEVTLPVPDGSFWVGDGSKRFAITITKANGSNDVNSSNNSAYSSFNLPDIFPGKIVLNLKSNNVPSDNKLVVKNMWGGIVHTRQNMAVNTNYLDTLNLGAGCYTLELTDEGHDGLSYWANTAQGSGNFRILNGQNIGTLKNFGADFGAKIVYSFGISKISNVAEQPLEAAIEVYPNPSQGQFNVSLEGLNGNFQLEVYSSNGQRIWEENVEVNQYKLHPLNLTPKAGVYIVRISGEGKSYSRKMIVQ